jgi:hypothetical protein
MNGGSCIDLINDFQCQCPAGYLDKDCSREYDPCIVSPCSALSSGNTVVVIGVSLGCIVIIIFLTITLFAVRSVKKARATRGTYSPSTQEMFGNSAIEILKPPPEERLI